MGNICDGNTNIKIIQRALANEVAVGRVFTERAYAQARNNILSLNIFSSPQFKVEPDDENGSITAEILLQEKQRIWSDVKTDWNIYPGRFGIPTIDLLRPGATIECGHCNIKGLGRSLKGAMKVAYLFDPEDDIDFNFDYTHP
ncbi:putative translocon at the outer envelope membrane of chloroplasts 75-III [Castilleja foliolosa]|uniref:Translocon at the outer envelope membrane of chloroplasts 75-III n=1 Tax=Castilleja foliolosa TaxID=1961234 RepID=A0ABD3CGF7_9LAMI